MKERKREKQMEKERNETIDSINKNNITIVIHKLRI